jgi:AcrR family transcriptional regulator
MTVMAHARTAERRERVLDAARFLALRHGLKAITMEAIAREARIAKPTLYSYFPDKAAVFTAVMEALIADLRQAFDAGLRGDGDVIERVAAALTAKHKAILRLLEGSPHAEELYNEHDRAAGPQFLALEEAIIAAIATELAKAGVARPIPLTQLLVASVHGIGRKAKLAPTLGPAIRLVTERLVGPELRGYWERGAHN